MAVKLLFNRQEKLAYEAMVEALKEASSSYRGISAESRAGAYPVGDVLIVRVLDEKDASSGAQKGPLRANEELVAVVERKSGDWTNYAHFKEQLAQLVGPVGLDKHLIASYVILEGFKMTPDDKASIGMMVSSTAAGVPVFRAETRAITALILLKLAKCVLERQMLCRVKPGETRETAIDMSTLKAVDLSEFGRRTTNAQPEVEAVNILRVAKMSAAGAQAIMISSGAQNITDVINYVTALVEREGRTRAEYTLASLPLPGNYARRRRLGPHQATMAVKFAASRPAGR